MDLHATSSLLGHTSLAQPNACASFSELKDPPKGNKAVPDGDSIFPHPTPLCPTLSLPLRETPKPVKAG